MYNIVAVKDFNMGAMENKSLNVFNTSLTLAREDTATDDDYEQIEGVIGHEYFHNWTALLNSCHIMSRLWHEMWKLGRTGNRVTCRDWFQLTLKDRRSPSIAPLAFRRVSRCTATKSSLPTWALERRSASRTCASCARPSSRRTMGPWRIRFARRSTPPSTTSTLPRSMRRGLR